MNQFEENFKDFLRSCDYNSPPTDGNNIVRFAGIDRIDRAIKNILKSKEYFFEYSLLPSAINPNTRNLLIFSGIRTACPVFKKNVEDYFQSIINTLYPTPTDGENDKKIETLSKNWFHNPEMFLFPTIEKISPVCVKPTGNKGITVTIPVKNTPFVDVNVVDNDNGESKLYYKDLSYERSIEDMLHASSLIASSNYSAEDLLEKVKNGAKCLASYYNEYIGIGNEPKDYRFLIFPIVSAQDKILNKFYSRFYKNLTQEELNKHTIGTGHFFIYFKTKRTPIIKTQWKLFYQINHLLAHISLNYVYSTGLSLRDQAYRAAVKAAYAQAMARNMSHNIGSHVMAHLLGKNIHGELANEKVCSLNDYEPIIALNYDSSKSTPPDQLAFFNRYLKQRMDYMSEVAISVGNLETSRWIYKEVMADLDNVLILLNYISGVQGFKYSFKIYNGDTEITPSTDLRASFPDDILGCQAFYNILENIIRNTAKHSPGVTKDVIFTIRFKDIDGCDDISEAKSLYCVEIDNGLEEENVETVVKDLNKQLNASILEEGTLKLRNRGLGLAEMECSAAFLRQIALDDIDSDDYEVEDNGFYYHKDNASSLKKLNIIKAFVKKTDDKTGRGVFGYRLFIKKPKDFLFVDNTATDYVDEDRKKKLANCGIEFCTQSELKRDLSSGKSFPHRFLVFWSSSAVCSFSAEEKALLPLRQITLSCDTSETKLEKLNNLNNLESDLLSCTSVCPEDSNKRILVEGFPVCKHFGPQVIFINHPGLCAFKKALECKDGHDTVWIEGLPSLQYRVLPHFYSLSIGDSTDLLVNYINNIRDNKIIKQILFEAYNKKIVVLDERLQTFAEENVEDGVPVWALFRTTNVIIPRFCSEKSFTCHPCTSFCEKKPPTYEQPQEPTCKQPQKCICDLLDCVCNLPLAPKQFSDEIRLSLEMFIDKNIDDTTFLLIHYGILERAYKEKDSIKEKLIAWAEKSERVVVTSGRGSHSLNLPDSVCFVNFSSVQNACQDNRNKYSLFNLINQARRLSHGKSANIY